MIVVGTKRSLKDLLRTIFRAVFISGLHVHKKFGHSVLFDSFLFYLRSDSVFVTVNPGKTTVVLLGYHLLHSEKYSTFHEEGIMCLS